MTRTRIRSLAAFAMLAAAGTAIAQSDKPWDGLYGGFNAGSASNKTCTTWAPREAVGGLAIDSAVDYSVCASDAFVGGAQLGDNFQYGHLIWGAEFDLDYGASSSHSGSVKYTGESVPSGTYAFSDKVNPSAFAILAPRLGYANSEFMAYVKGGAMFPFGSRNTLDYTPTGTTKATASFEGSKSFSSVGWVAGGGAEWGFNGPWSIGLEYLHVNLGKGSQAAASCNGTSADCAQFSGILFDNQHGGFSATMIRISINYWFGYWEPQAR
jgi:outer membrane immunogenic protein